MSSSMSGGFNRPGAALRGGLSLEYPMSLGVYTDYLEAQKAVDYLSDNQFPVQNVMIVGTDLKQIERVVGRLTWGRVIAGGALSGAWFGAFIGLILSLFDNGVNVFAVVISTIIFGAIFGAIWAAIGYSLTGGQRDFQSVTQTVATKYEVLVEHKFAEQAREMLAKMPGGGPTLT
ncbi:general stress protein [Flexivirga meconopsidis]|uniref:general stress protein n=1 Tax=Flexivirga meconopsidis TaxID=2977121 RepID=UPI00224099F5|nr:general stress protein [Flexivirga meconopsidis]